MTNSVRVSIPTPLLPGVWEVKVYHEGFLIAGTKFLVIPLEFVASSAMTAQQAKYASSHDLKLNMIKSFKKHFLLQPHSSR